MVALPMAGGVTPGFRLPNPPSWARPSGHLQGNDLPPQTGPTFDQPPDKPGPGPSSGGQVGGYDGFFGSSPDQPKLPAAPRVVAPTIEGIPSNGGYGPPLGYGQGASRFSGIDRWGWAARLNAPNLEDPLPHGRESWWRGGIQGFSDKLTAKDRHAYWDAGHQKQGTDFSPASSPPNTYNNPLQEPPLPELRTVNRTVSYQKGTDITRHQDDLSRPYTWLGEQGSGWAPVYGGVPGMYQPYGSRGGVPFPIQSPVAEGDPADGPRKVWAGPPHGLHSMTYPDRGDTLDRYAVNPQMRPVRVDRPSNSPQAGQSYNQTVMVQGGTRPFGAQAQAQGWTAKISGRGWLGTGA